MTTREKRYRDKAFKQREHPIDTLSSPAYIHVFSKKWCRM